MRLPTTAYIRFVTRCPLVTLLAYLAASALLTGIAIKFGGKYLSTDPHEGFETRGTDLARKRLLLDILARTDINKREFFHNSRSKRDADQVDSSGINPDYQDYGNEPIGMDDITSGCDQYYALGRFYPANVIDLMAKIVIEVKDVNEVCYGDDIDHDKLFSLDTLKEMCELDHIIETVSSNFGVEKRFPYSFNLPHYVMCMNSTVTSFREQLLTCEEESDETCNSSIAQQLRHYILGTDLFERKGPVHVGAILNVPLQTTVFDSFNEALHNELVNNFKSDHFSVIGTYFNNQESHFLIALHNDMYLAVGSVIVVVVGVLLYAGDPCTTILLIVGLVLSIGVGFFLYVFVVGVRFFPFLNMLVVVIVTVVGVDDCFLLMFQYRSFKAFFPKTESMQNAIEHAAKAMFVTSATTAAAFLTNLFSNILVLRCFGMFAGLAIMSNYLFAVSAMPAAVLWVDSLEIDLFNKVRGRLSFGKWHDQMVALIPNVVDRFKYLTIFLSAICLMFSTMSILCYPGLKSPENNPMQLLRSSHPVEWFAEHQTQLFNFSFQGERFLNLNFIWGLEPVSNGASFNPSDFGNLSLDPKFKVESVDQLRQFRDVVMAVRDLKQVRRNKVITRTWVEEFYEFALGRQSETNVTRFNFGQLAKEFTKFSPVHMFPDDFTMTFKDGPLFVKGGVLLGYFAIAPSHHQISMSYKAVRLFMDTMTDIQSELCHTFNNTNFIPMVSPISYVAKLADLFSTLMENTVTSVFISVAVSLFVIFVTTVDLFVSFMCVLSIFVSIVSTFAIVLWLGWVVNVVEAVLIVITIGLSFDYTLHLAVAFRTSPVYLSTEEKLRRALELVLVPVLWSASTTAGSGVVLLWSETQPFLELGTFLLSMSLLSLTTTILLFPALLLVRSGKQKRRD